jgi:metal-responsive CopG/Arc/MetJ family transcriptional regulator
MPVTAALRKKGARPSTGEMPVSAIRLSAEMRQKVERWADRQNDKPSRSEAIRRLVEIGLKAKK